jgi:hypothetical protein
MMLSIPALEAYLNRLRASRSNALSRGARSSRQVHELKGKNPNGSPLWSHSRDVVCFGDAFELLRNALPAEPSIPDACGKGHPLTPENLQVEFRARKKAA